MQLNRRHRRRLTRRRRLATERELESVEINNRFAALGELAEQHFVGEHTRDLILDKSPQRPRPETRIMAMLRQPLLRRRRHRERDLLLVETLLQFRDELVDDA